MELSTSELRVGDFPAQTRELSVGLFSNVARRKKCRDDAHHPFDNDVVVYWAFLLAKKARLRAAAITRLDSMSMSRDTLENS